MASFLKKVFAPLRQNALSSYDHDGRYYIEAEVNVFCKFIAQLFVRNEEVCYG